jgi:RNA polymerase sigma-70 factor (ECF subfamily)
MCCGEVPRVSDAAPRLTQSSGAPADARASSAESDDRILRDFFKGAERDRARLYKHVLPLCRSTIGRMLGPGHPQTEDLVQSSVELIVRTLVHGTFSRRCSLKTWAVAITRNVVKNEARVLRRDRNYLVSEDLDTYAHQGDAICAIEQEEVRSAVRNLPSEMAQALLLHDLCGYTAAEIAEQVGLTSSGAQSRIARARDLARRDLCSRSKLRTHAA